MAGSARVVGVTADRRGDEQAVLLRRYGLEVFHGPMMATVVVAAEGPLRTVTDDVIARPPDILVANTGIGIRTWMAAAREWGLDADLLAVLGRARIAARGPKVTGALRSAGLEPWWRAPTEQLAEIRDHLVEIGVAGCRIAVQRHGEDAPLADALAAAGAEVVEVPVYRWEIPAESARALALIEAVAERTVDAVTFTSGPAVRNMMEMARRVGLADQVLAALNGPEEPTVLAACVGPVCAGVARDEGLANVIFPEHWRLGSLVRLVAEELSRRAG